MGLWAKYFPKIDHSETARKLSKEGSYGVLIFVGMYVLGMVFAVFFNQDPMGLQPLDAQGVRNHVIGSAILIPIMMVFAYRVSVGKGWFVAGLVLVWFLVEITWKVASGSANVGWFVFYVAVAAMIVNGMRGCWWMRSADSDQAALPAKSKTVFGVAAVLAAAAIGISLAKGVGKDAFSNPPHTQAQIDEQLYEGFSRAAVQLNEKGPVMVDEETRWDRSEAGPGPRLTYFYTFPNYSSDGITREWLLENLQPDITGNVCRNEEMKPSLQYGGTYVYVFAGNDGVEIARFEINRNDCGLPAISP